MRWLILGTEPLGRMFWKLESTQLEPLSLKPLAAFIHSTQQPLSVPGKTLSTEMHSVL